MAIDMTTVKQIMHNNKEVVKIEDGLGKVLWQKVTGPEWHTLWSGSEYAEIYTTYAGSYYTWRSTISNNNVLATIPIEAMADGCQLRITWSYSWGTYPNSSSRYYYKNNSSSRTLPEQPYVIDTKSLVKGTNIKAVGLLANGNSDSRYQGEVYLKWDSNTRELKLYADYSVNQNIGRDYSARFTVTKIELYYTKPSNPIELYEGYYLRSYSAAKDTNYIDLGIKWDSTYKIEGHYYRPNVSPDYSRLLGTGYGTTREIQIDYPVASGSTNQRQLIGNTYTNTSSNTSSTNVRYGFALGNRGSNCESWYWSPQTDWKSFGSSWSNSLGTSDYNLRLFSATQGDRDGIYGISDVKINGPSDLWSDDGALMFLVPAKRGDVYGMCDKNNGVFYSVTTSGSGYFKITNVNDEIIA